MNCQSCRIPRIPRNRVSNHLFSIASPMTYKRLNIEWSTRLISSGSGKRRANTPWPSNCRSNGPGRIPVLFFLPRDHRFIVPKWMISHERGTEESNDRGRSSWEISGWIIQWILVTMELGLSRRICRRIDCGIKRMFSRLKRDKPRVPLGRERVWFETSLNIHSEPPRVKSKVPLRQRFF